MPQMSDSRTKCYIKGEKPHSVHLQDSFGNGSGVQWTSAPCPWPLLTHFSVTLTLVGLATSPSSRGPAAPVLGMRPEPAGSSEHLDCLTSHQRACSTRNPSQDCGAFRPVPPDPMSLVLDVLGTLTLSLRLPCRPASGPLHRLFLPD